MRGTHPTYMSERHAQHSHMTMRGTNPVIYVRKAQHWYLTMSWTNPAFMLERLCTYIWPCEEPIQHTCQKGFALIFSHARNQSNIHVKRALHLHLTMRGTIPAYMSKWLSTLGWWFLLTNQVPPFSQRMTSALISDHVGTHPSITS